MHHNRRTCVPVFCLLIPPSTHPPQVPGNHRSVHCLHSFNWSLWSINFDLQKWQPNTAKGDFQLQGVEPGVFPLILCKLQIPRNWTQTPSSFLIGGDFAGHLTRPARGMKCCHRKGVRISGKSGWAAQIGVAEVCVQAPQVCFLSF